ncbi:MAG: T9SS type A sorting domain-containing protein [Saprospiraceae bacterium]|nr:T9SS type A sorting domain-containing protein [Saprospiraceae bacterium]
MKSLFIIFVVLFSTIHFAYAYDVTVAKDGSGNYTTVQAAVDAAPTGRTTPYTIFIKNGTYKEVITVPSNKPFLQFIGESVANVILTYDNYSGKPIPGGGGATYGTSNSASTTINATDFTAINISFENTTGESPQALAINVNNDRCAFFNCRFLGGQDTLLANNSGKKQYYKQCYIDGTVDFIFGNATAIFEDCTIYPKTRSSAGSSYITAANTQAGITYGYVFRNCIIQMNRGTTSYFLGRPWQNSTGSSPVAENKVVFLNTTQSGSIILPAGWSTWDAGTNTALITYAEYQSVTQTGAAVDVSSRVAWSQQLNATQAATYSNTNIFGTWDPCSADYIGTCTGGGGDIAVANLKGTKGASTTVFTWNASWGIAGVTYSLERSTDNGMSYTSIYSRTAADQFDVNFTYTDNNPPSPQTYYYRVVASKSGLTTHTTASVSISSTPTLTATAIPSSFLQGLGTPSTAQSFTLTGVNLLGDATITPPTPYEISFNNSTWSSTPLSITPTSGAISQTVYVRLNGTTVGSYNGNITISSSVATDATVAVIGTIQSAPVLIPVTLAYYPMTASNADQAGSRAAGVTVPTPTFGGLVSSNGTTVPAVPSYSSSHGQAFAATADGLWTTASGGPGGNLNLNNYEQFTITANSGYSVWVESFSVLASFYNTSSNTKLTVLYSTDGFATAGINATAYTSGGSAVTTTTNTQNSPLFTMVVTLGNETAGTTANYAATLNGSTGVTLSAGQTLSIRVYMSCGSSSTGRYGKLKDVYFKGVSSATIPLSILDFKAKKQADATNKIEWTTADEVNTRHFDVERSADGHDFETIGTVKAAGYSKTQKSYSLIDKTPLSTGSSSNSTTNYYRLKSVDLDGSTTYSKIVEVENSKQPFANIKVYPNPTSDQVIIEHPSIDNDLTFTITDVKGQKHRVKTTQKGEQTTFDVQSLANGVYFIDCQYKNNRTVLKFEKH